MKYSATFNELKSAGFEIEFVSASANYDMTAVVKLKSPEGKIIYTSYWIGDKSYRYADALDGILTGEGEIRFDDCMMMLDEFKGVDDYRIFSYIQEGTSSLLREDEIWNIESLKIADDTGKVYMTRTFNV